MHASEAFFFTSNIWRSSVINWLFKCQQNLVASSLQASFLSKKKPQEKERDPVEGLCCLVSEMQWWKVPKSLANFKKIRREASAWNYMRCVFDVQISLVRQFPIWFLLYESEVFSSSRHKFGTKLAAAFSRRKLATVSRPGKRLEKRPFWAAKFLTGFLCK